MNINVWGMIKVRKYGWVGLTILAVVACVVLFFYFDRRDEISYLIRAWGFGGVFLAILLMGIICMTPIPSEGLMLLYLKIYGIFLGILYSWVGSVIGSLAIFLISRVYIRNLMQKLIKPEHIDIVDSWVEVKGSLGLLIVRLFPIPAFAVNYIAAAIPSTRLWSYLWTAALSMAPYYISTALVFLCVSRKTWQWLLLGSIFLIIMGGLKYTRNKRKAAAGI